jgi:hypothetical protein
MKVFKGLMLLVVLFLAIATTAGAYDVTIKNDSDCDISASVIGEHLFWRQEDCKVSVSKHSSATCAMPGAICPVYVTGTASTSGGSCKGGGKSIPLGTPGIAACWNTSATFNVNASGYLNE